MPPTPQRSRTRTRTAPPARTSRGAAMASRFRQLGVRTLTESCRATPSGPGWVTVKMRTRRSQLQPAKRRSTVVALSGVMGSGAPPAVELSPTCSWTPGTA